MLDKITISSCPVLDSYLYTYVIGGQVQIRWAGLSWYWPNAQPDLPIETICQISIASDTKPSLPIRNLPILISQEGPNLPKSANWVPAHLVPAHWEPANHNTAHNAITCTIYPLQNV